ncbi:hypothetical protein KKF05_05345 [Patescibacteria group bacterium]|nr:hypothetical protein [Patescibacteria group bacterium]MBU1029372.1 hypothetical protein [Patescibacteria group bacterium]MBU1915646.1 hypothetical protein [Patescibacteria group bacterium]
MLSEKNLSDQRQVDVLDQKSRESRVNDSRLSIAWKQERLAKIKDNLANLDQVTDKVESTQSPEKYSAEIAEIEETLEQPVTESSQLLIQKQIEIAAEFSKNQAKERRELQLEAAALEYFFETLPDSETRIETPMDAKCEVAIVVPAYGEREHILQQIESLAQQEGVSPEQFEAIFVINNPGEEPVRDPKLSDAQYERKLDQYHKAIVENQETLKLFRFINGEDIEVDVSEDELEIISQIWKSGLRLHTIDKSSPGRTFPSGEANVGSARNRGVAEAAVRFYENGQNGIIGQSDADSCFTPDYLANLIKTFYERPELIGLSGDLEFKASDQDAWLMQKIARQAEFEHKYWRLLAGLSSQAEIGLSAGQKQILTKGVHFSGANMASRSLEAAAVGGVPKLSGGEDPAFGERLAEVGQVESVPEVKVITAQRFSARTAEHAGHGQQLLKQLDLLQSGEQSKIMSPASFIENNRLRTDIETAIKEGQTSVDNLRKICQINGAPLMDEPDLILFSKKLTQNLDLEKLRNDPDLKAVMEKVKKRSDTLLPEVSFDVALNQLVDKYCIDPEIEKTYQAKLEAITAVEDQEIDNRRSLMKSMLEIVFKDRPEKVDAEFLIATLRQHATELNLSAERVKRFEDGRSNLDVLAKTINQASDAVDAFLMIVNIFPESLAEVKNFPERHQQLRLQALQETAQLKKN